MAGNKYIAAAVASLFQDHTDSDCAVVFTLELDAPVKRSHNGVQHSAIGLRQAAITVIGDPLPVVLRHASPHFAAQLSRWNDGKREARTMCTPGCNTGRPELRIPLGSEAELPSARAAIRFAYTGEVHVSTVREVLEVRRQAAYLQIKGCTAACDEAIRGMVEAEESGGDSSEECGAADQQHAVLAFYACETLWSDADEDHSFQSLISAADQQLVSYFGNTLRVLNTPPLRRQLLDLPAVAVEALLESDSFGTDSESSVLLMLAVWMQANHYKTDAETRKRLCRLVRLVQLIKPYLSFVLPALAEDNATTKPFTAGWFTTKVSETAFISHFARAQKTERKQLLVSAKGSSYDIGSPMYSFYPRQQCVPEAGLTYHWHVSQEKLEQVLEMLQPGQEVYVNCTFDNGWESVSAQGFDWTPCLGLKHGAKAAGLYLDCKLPGALCMRGHTPAVVSSCARLTVARASKACVQQLFGTGDFFIVGQGWGSPGALPLRRLMAAGGGGGGAAVGLQLLAGWSEYLQGGKISGSLTLLRQPAGKKR
ncbi:hypothetical protein Agub_g9645 [Astrephomene gubernaculifera]|uniref:BACK domain-containing protein n=1 Tax=Astrephomene gubernaculifera TaxID=47775 RepID=A0AAD3HP58_9CHLO|nr:hypothetical protein Agub_g9645 [Astrephomene gubernaculifera]